MIAFELLSKKNRSSCKEGKSQLFLQLLKSDIYATLILYLVSLEDSQIINFIIAPIYIYSDIVVLIIETYNVLQNLPLNRKALKSSGYCTSDASYSIF